MKTFKPMLAPNKEIDLDTVNYPVLASNKLDGIRCIFHPELGMVSRSLKKIQNPNLQKKFSPLVKYSEDTGCVLDGELYCHRMTFQEITSIVMTKNNPPVVPSDFKFHCFDVLDASAIGRDMQFNVRNLNVERLENKFERLVKSVGQSTVYSTEDVKERFNKALDAGYEGLILKKHESLYKFGRATPKEDTMYKVKPYRTFDATVIDVIQATRVDPNAEKTINELGRSVTSKKKDDRIPIESASAFLCKYEGHDVKVVIAMTDNEKAEIWNNRQNYIGKVLEYKGMILGAKDVPRHPVMTRWRTDKE